MNENFKERVATWGYTAGWGAVRFAPEKLAHVVFAKGADAAFRRGAGGQLRKNLARVLGCEAGLVPDELIRDSLRSYARYWCQVFRLPAMDHARLARDVNAAVTEQQHLDEAQARGRGVVIALPHMGNWDLAGVWLVGRSGQFTTVAERLKPESVYQRFLAYRESLGFEILPHEASPSAVETGPSPSAVETGPSPSAVETGPSPSAVETGPSPSAVETEHAGPYQVLAQRLREGKVVCLLADRGMGRSGIGVRFFGEMARFPAGPAKLAVETGAALVTAHTWYEPDTSWRARIGPPIDTGEGVEAATQRLADSFAATISEHPADWHMLQPLWDKDRARREPA